MTSTDTVYEEAVYDYYELTLPDTAYKVRYTWYAEDDGVFVEIYVDGIGAVSFDTKDMASLLSNIPNEVMVILAPHLDIADA